MSNTTNANILISQYDAGTRDFTDINLNSAKFYGSLHHPILLAHIILEKADIENGIFSHVDLTGANFRRANLNGCSFTGPMPEVDFTEANLSNTKIGPGDRRDAVFAYANLTNADFGGNHSRATKQADYENIDLRYANLTGAQLTSNFSGADFRGAQLTNAIFKDKSSYWYRATLIRTNFHGVDLKNHDLSGLDLSEANLSDTNLTNTNLAHANLTGADLRGAILEGTILDQANLLNAQFDDTFEAHGKNFYAWAIQNQQGMGRDFGAVDLTCLNLKECDLSRSNLTEANLEQTNLASANLQDAQLQRANLYRANLTEAQLANSNLQGIRAIGANFSGSSLASANLIQADLTDACFVGATLATAHLQGANLSNANLIGSDLSKANLDDCTLTNAIIFDVDFSQAVNVPEKLLNYIEISHSLGIRPLHRFTTISEQQLQICNDQYGPDASQYNNYAVWFDQVPLLPSYQVPRSLLDTLFSLSPITQETWRGNASEMYYSSPFFFNIFSKPSSLLGDLEPTTDEKRELMKLGAKIFAPIKVFFNDLESDYAKTIKRPLIRQSSEEFAQWIIKTSGLILREDGDGASAEIPPNTARITSAATELATLVGQEVVICLLNEGDYNENEQYSAYAVISQNYLMFFLKYWEL
ncbi:pentapeptide repeat-containing protein [Acaryochloris sp. IP29b_bin.137]|uniref:pentapeptide repeat-containing protein n=1 Tax=Acaryochloris sp. IP29b_bin.137 TaxID=2969217 RepID=UPI00261CF1CA|nr:pentapeptide repeat-containing protein [Acaryochloris sp. IP29b_bin.137]